MIIGLAKHLITFKPKINHSILDAYFSQSLKVLEKVPNMYLVISPTLIILTASDPFLEATKTTRETIVGKHIFEAFPDNPELPDADGVKNINASLQEVLRSKRPHFMDIQRYDVPDVTSAGKFITRYWEPSHTPVLNEEGEIQYIIQHANNITDKVLRLAELAESRSLEFEALQKIELLNLELDLLRLSELENQKNEKHFRYLADLIPAKISNALPTGEVTYFNKQWLDYSGMNFEDLRDFGYHQMMHPDEIEIFQIGLEKAAQTGVPFESEMRFRDLSGKYRWHLNIAAPILDDSGKVILWVGSTTEIQRLKDEDQRKSDFLSMLSHELKTPVTSIKGYVHIIDSIINDHSFAERPPILRSSLIRIDKLINQLTGLITEMLDFARLEANRMTINKYDVNLSSLVETVVDDFKLSHPEYTFVLDISKDFVIQIDGAKMEQVINNLISNAIKYSPYNTDINIRIFSRDIDRVAISITDNGLGIDKAEHEKIFERFYRVEENTKEYFSGFGIGLFVGLGIARQHNGDIEIISEKGKGSTFTIVLPLG